MEIIVGCNCRSDLSTFRSTEVVIRRTERMQEKDRGTNDLLCIYRAVIRGVKSRKKNLAMAWIDYKKVYDMVPNSWIKECFYLFRVAENIKTLLVSSMEKWKVMLCAGNSDLGEVDVKRGIFQ